MKTEKYSIIGMSCAACSASVNRVVSRLDGVKECDVNLITGKMTVRFDERKVTTEDFFRVVKKAGFGITKENNTEATKTEETKKDYSLVFLIVAGIFSFLLLYLSMGQMVYKDIPIPFFINIHSAPYNFALTQLLLCIPVLFIGRHFFLKGIPLLFRGHPNMDSLIAVGVGSAFIYSLVMTYMIPYYKHAVHNLYYESVAVVITLIMLGKYFETRSKSKTAGAIKRLMSLSPDKATVVKDDIEYTVDTKDIMVGYRLVVKPGEKIPLDGNIVKGESDIDESMLTGESMPVFKTVGDYVTGGSINKNGIIYIEVTRVGQDTTLSKIIKFVEEAQSKKAPISKVADRVAGVFVPIVLVIAIVSGLIWLLIEKDVALALKIFTSVLVIACPCALGLATPTAIMVGTGLGASNGILIRNGEVLEITHNTKAAVFDKTGTVTEGKPTVTDIISNNQDEILTIAVTIESLSTHPIASAITEYAKEKNISKNNDVTDFKNIPGKGLTATINGNHILAGNMSFMTDNEISLKDYEKDAAIFSSEGKSIVFIAKDAAILGMIAVADKLKKTSETAFRQLKKLGVKTILLSGDNKACVSYTGKLLHADEVYSEVLPEQKADIVKRIRKKYGPVMMIGDGINDAPSLTEADVGCAIGSGSDIAIEAADIVLIKNNPMDVAKAIRLSRLTITNIKENLFWAFCYNTVCIPIAAGILHAFGGPLLSPMLAGLAMSLSSVCVVTNALRLRSKKL